MLANPCFCLIFATLFLQICMCIKKKKYKNHARVNLYSRIWTKNPSYLFRHTIINIVSSNVYTLYSITHCYFPFSGRKEARAAKNQGAMNPGARTLYELLGLFHDLFLEWKVLSDVPRVLMIYFCLVSTPRWTFCFIPFKATSFLFPYLYK